MTTVTLFRAANAVRWSLIGVLLAVLIVLSACGGGGTDPSTAAAATAADSAASTTTQPAASTPASSQPAPAAPMLAACPVGPTILFISICTCPEGDKNGSTCTVPAPAPAAPPAPPPPPTMSLSYAQEVAPIHVYSLVWTSTGAQQCVGATGFPLNGVLPPNGEVSLLTLTVTSSYTLVCNGPGGNATASVTINISPPPVSSPPGSPPPTVCTAPDILVGATCVPPPVLTLSLAISPPVVSDARAGCPAPDGTTCTATVNLNPTSSLPGTIVCQDAAGNNIVNVDGWSTAQYPAAQDGPHVLAFQCQQYGIAVSQSITLTVQAPGAPPAPTFACALNGNTLACTWSTFGTEGCSVYLSDSPGTQYVLSPGGTASGSAVSGFLSSAYDPWTAALYCAGEPAPGLSTITVSP